MGRWGDGDPPLTPTVEGNLGRWGDGEMRVFFYLQGKLPGLLLGNAGSHPLFPHSRS
ncbi:MAG: hypothetical protein F6K18_18685 [Okeania sp. SIO2C2]|uniref:hypothetical protein n=1 Tax=Okeania sp. SIO2C2 TaxID=2607787 RepID=UPI0013BA248F|nr:hypothetical protein [Okeania sp. SIO2C2]NEP88697.1 hypothetical protein [Okeania sp. SIO2C2]